MARNNDFGDQFPGDSDDQVPSDPLTGLNELDYDPGLVTRAKSFQGRSREQFIPDLGKVKDVTFIAPRFAFSFLM